MLMILSIPILLIIVGGVVATYALISALSIALKILVYILLFVIIIGILWLLSIPYRKCDTKGEKFFYCLFVTICSGILFYVFISKINTTDISVINECKNEIITEVIVIPVDDDRYQLKEREILNSSLRAFRIRSTDEMTNKSRKLGFKYNKGEEYAYLKDDEQNLVGGIWNTEVSTNRIPMGAWIITLKTYNPSTGDYYYIIYTQNAFKTHLGEHISFSYSGEKISLMEREDSKYIPEIIGKHFEKEISKKFDPKIIVITKKTRNVISGLIIQNKSEVGLFPDIQKGKYEFYSVAPENTYTAKVYFSEWNGQHYVEVSNEIKEISVGQDCIVFYFDQEKKTVKQLQSIKNCEKFKL